MVLVGVSLVAFLGIAAFAIDISRMYLFRAQVQTSGDAAALAAAKTLANYQGSAGASAAVSVGIAVGQSNTVDGNVPTINNADIVPVTWTFGSPPSYTVNGSWADTSNNGVRAISRYTANYGFGRIFGLLTRDRVDTSVAAIGSAGYTDCVKPWAIPYQSLLTALQNVTGISYPLTHNLSTGEVALISQFTAANNLISLASAGTGNATVSSGAFGAVGLPDTLGQTQAIGGLMDEYLYSRCGSARMNNIRVGPGTFLPADGGLSGGNLRKGLNGWCAQSGAPGSAANNSFSCPGPPTVPPIRMAIWDKQGSDTLSMTTSTTCGGAGTCWYHTKYLGGFVVVQYLKGDSITGYFTGMVTSGSFSSAPGIVKKLALVK